MSEDGRQCAQFKWDQGDDELERGGKEQRRYAAWKVFLPGFVVLAGALALGALVAGNHFAIVVIVAAAAGFQLFLSQTLALRRAEVEYLWPIEQRIRFGAAAGATYREKARHAEAKLDDFAVRTRDVLEVQVRSLVAPHGSEEHTEVFLLFEHRVILVERSADRATLAEYAVLLRERFELETEPESPRPIAPAPTQLGGWFELLLTLVFGAAAGAGVHFLPQFLDALVWPGAVALFVAAGCALTFRAYRAWLRRAMRRWVQEEFGIDARPARADGGTNAG